MNLVADHPLDDEQRTLLELFNRTGVQPISPPAQPTADPKRHESPREQNARRGLPGVPSLGRILHDEHPKRIASGACAMVQHVA